MVIVINASDIGWRRPFVRVAVVTLPNEAQVTRGVFFSCTGGLCFSRFALLTGLVLLVACQRVTLGARTSHVWGTPHELTIGIVSDPFSLNPLFTVSQTSIDTGLLYTETLVSLNDRNQVIPLLATRVPTRSDGDISADGLTITYHLRRDERFADGVPLTSRDVAFTYRAILDRRNPVAEAQPYHEIASLTTPDPYTVRIRLRRRWAAAVSELFAVSDFAYGILPAHAFSGNPNVAHADWNEHPFGSGPFRVVSWQHGDQIVLEPNPYARRRPHLRRLILKIIPDRNSMMVALRTRAIDVADLIDTQVAQVEALSDLRLVRTAKNYVVFLDFQTERAPTNEPLVRRAITEGIDRDAILKNVFLGLYPPANTEIPEVLWAHDAAIATLPFDPKQAAADLDAAGWKMHNGTRMRGDSPLEIDLAFFGTSSQDRRLATEVQAQLRAIGIVVSLHGYPTTLIYAPASAGGIGPGGRFNLQSTGWYGGSDPEASEADTCAMRAPNGPNYARWCSPEYDRFYAQQKTSDDRTVRMRAFSGMQRLMREANVADFLAYPALYTAVNPSLSNFRPNMLFEFWNSDEWDVK